MKINFFKPKKEKESMRMKLIKELIYDHGYSILRSSQTLKENEELMKLSKQFDEYGYMSQQLGDELDNLFLDDDYIVGIHRTGYTYMDEETINKIFNEGLINNGHIMSGGMSGTCDIDKTVSLFYDFTMMNGQLKAAYGYKGSQGCVIVKIPKSYLGLKEGEVQPIYYKKDSTVRLLPEFIYGYVPVKDQGILGDLIHNPNYKENHTLVDNSNLLYEDKVLIQARKKGNPINIEDISLNEKYDILLNAYKETYTKYGDKQADHALLQLINQNDVQYFTGGNNRYNLKKYVCYGNILKIMCFGLDNLENKDIDSIIKDFSETAIKSDTNKKTIL